MLNKTKPTKQKTQRGFKWEYLAMKKRGEGEIHADVHELILYIKLK